MASPSSLDEVARLITRLGNSAPSPQVIRAYHGSPYDFDRFDASKIGAGQGAASYAHGLYFAGNEAVAKKYRDQLKDMLDIDPTERQSLDLQDAWNDWMAKQQLVREWDKPSSGLSNLLAEFGEQNPHRAAERESAARWMRLSAEIERTTKNPGRMYEVEIGYPESSLLDWDRPLTSQGAFVNERLSPFRTDRYDLDPKAGTDIETGATALHRIAAAFDDDMGEASAALFKAGIPGIKYWDAGSRSAQKGTRNYVMFPGTEDSIRILRKF